MVVNKSLLTVSQVAQLFGISRVAVFKRIKKGQLPAMKYGRFYLIDKKDLPNVLSTDISEERKIEIDHDVAKTVKEYRETLKLLGKE